MVIRWPGWIQAIVLASVFLLFFFSWLNRFLMKDYTKEWQDRKERRQFWEDAQEKSGIRDPLFFISEEELPKEEEYLEIYSDGSGGVRDDAPDFFQVKVAQLAYPEGKGYPDYEALPKLLAASLGGSESSVGISPIGELVTKSRRFRTRSASAAFVSGGQTASFRKSLSRTSVIGSESFSCARSSSLASLRTRGSARRSSFALRRSRSRLHARSS